MLGEHIRLGNICKESSTQAAKAAGKQLWAKPVTDAWDKGNYVEAVTRGGLEVGTLLLMVGDLGCWRRRVKRQKLPRQRKRLKLLKLKRRRRLQKPQKLPRRLKRRRPPRRKRRLKVVMGLKLKGYAKQRSSLFSWEI